MDPASFDILRISAKIARLSSGINPDLDDLLVNYDVEAEDIVWCVQTDLMRDQEDEVKFAVTKGECADDQDVTFGWSETLPTLSPDVADDLNQWLSECRGDVDELERNLALLEEIDKLCGDIMAGVSAASLKLSFNELLEMNAMSKGAISRQAEKLQGYLDRFPGNPFQLPAAESMEEEDEEQDQVGEERRTFPDAWEGGMVFEGLF
jgi:hypothetical protein